MTSSHKKSPSFVTVFISFTSTLEAIWLVWKRKFLLIHPCLYEPDTVLDTGARVPSPKQIQSLPTITMVSLCGSRGVWKEVRTIQMSTSKAISSGFAIAREAATITCIWQAEEWGSFVADKREGFRCALTRGCWPEEARGRPTRREESYVIGYRCAFGFLQLVLC